jgi:hypothetical protein
MCLRRAPEKYIAGAALDRAALHSTNRVICSAFSLGLCTTQFKRFDLLEPSVQVGI